MIYGLVVLKGGYGNTYLFTRKKDMIEHDTIEKSRGFKTTRFYKPFMAVRVDGENSCTEWGIKE